MKWSNEVTCPICKGSAAMRVNRNGFLQQTVLSFFGLYPWKCGACGSTFLFRSRGHGRRPTQHAHEGGGAAHK
jgi:hypothetical protein